MDQLAGFCGLVGGLCLCVMFFGLAGMAKLILASG
jgi:hypothetical protein